ncbi:MAG: HAD family hydrolase [Spirochaetaceae bacterium]|nr:MAG: HAD family hydrolase [Spirochaetaceae bacterium]
MPKQNNQLKHSNQAVVFDYDGTLIDSRRVKVRNYRDAVETVFSPPESMRTDIEESCLRTMGANRFVQLEDTLRVLGMSASRQQRENWSLLYSALNRRTIPSVAEFPSVRRLLSGLEEAGYALFAASGILEAEFLQELAKRGFSRFFLEAKGGDKEAFLRSLKDRGFAPILFVGDTIYDQRTAEKVGVSFFRIDTEEDVRKLESRLLPT